MKTEKLPSGLNVDTQGGDLILVVVTQILGLGPKWRVKGLGLVQLRFHVTLGDVVTQ